MEPTHEGLDFDLSQAERIVESAVEQNDGETGEVDPPGVSGELVGGIDIAKGKARAVVKMLENLFRMKEPRLSFGEETYQEAEEQLAPVLLKHDLSEAGPLKYAEEVNALGFIGGLGFSSFGVIRQLRADDEAAEKAANQQRGGTDGGES